MKKISKNETDMLDLINKIQAQLFAIDKKVDTLINRSISEAKPSSPAPSANTNRPPINPNDSHKGRMKFTAICADCNKECTIPFKPSGDRPVYCQDCFSRRKVIKLSKMGMDDKPKEAPSASTVTDQVITAEPPAKKKKKAAAAKKPVTKKKVTTKRK